MRFFKFGTEGDVIAIALPASIQKSAGITIGSEYEFVELGEGAILLVSKAKLAQLARSNIIGSLGERILCAPTAKAQETAPVAAMQSRPLTPRPVAPSTPHPSEWVEASYLTQQQAAAGSSPTAPPMPSITPKEAEKQLEKEGFVVLGDEETARTASLAFEAQIKSGNIVGVRGFDKKYYIVSKWFFDSLSEKIKLSISGKEAGVQEIALAAKTSEPAATAVLQVMKDKGDAIEKRRGVFRIIPG